MSTAGVNSSRFLNFTLVKKEYAVPLEIIREVITFPKISRIPSSSAYLLGLISLREEVLPVIDLRTKLSLPPTLDHDTAVLICDCYKQTVGIVVDSISSVINPEQKDIYDLSTNHAMKNSEFVCKTIQQNNELILVLDLPKIISHNDIVSLKEQAGKPQPKAS